MKLKEKLIPHVYIEIDGYDMPVREVVDIINLAYEINYSEYDSYFHFDNWEENLKNVLVGRNLIECVSQGKTLRDTDYIITSKEEFKKFKREFWDLYNEMDRKQLSRERKLKELTNE